ncbi:hypothetical protein H5410_031263 [Solanum commersonii]|uniref:Putative plant transposon protein domain-containing protein n=1 Tax=Solanum commersonii TaxID=4109 RepID=A0A9J5YIM7_SOLCO|nr:hypothetical protein H5410_031263 [Solanum commersonii]
MVRDPGTYSKVIVREFYASYVATLRGSIHQNAIPTAQPPLTATLVRKFSVDISETTIRRFLYGPGPDHSWALNTAEFDYKWDSVRGEEFQHSAEKRKTLLQWLASQISTNGERAEWFTTVGVIIKKATLIFVAKFFWLLVRNRISPTKADNALTWDCAVMLCRDSGVPIWHCDKLIWPMGTLDIGLIQDEANVAAPRREPQVDVPPMGADLVDVVEQIQGDDPTPPAHTDGSEIGGSDGHAASPCLAKDPKFDSKVRGHNGAKDGEHDGPEASLRADVDAILATPAVEPQAAPIAFFDAMVLDALFSGDAEE